MTLEQYMQQLRQGESSALDNIYELTKAAVYTIAYTYVRDKQLAEDISQDTYISVIKHIGQYRPNTNSRAWILQIAKNLSLNYLSKHKRENLVDISKAYDLNSPETVTVFDESGIIALVERTLSPTDSQIVLLHNIGDLKFDEIAKITSINATTVRWRYGKALKILQKALKEEQ